MIENIPTIAFEGINRVGKGTQIEKLKSVLSELELSFVELRGDGTRDGLGAHEGDPKNIWWQENAKKLRSVGTTKEWNQAAYKLALEFINWKEAGAELNKEVILLDRSLVSRATFIIDRNGAPVNFLEIDDLYPEQNDRKISMEDVLPDIIFELSAPKDVLISRLDPTDPKYNFRAKIIESNYDKFYKAKEFLPESIRGRIVQLDSSLDIDKVFDSVMEEIDQRLNVFRQKHGE